VGALPSVLGGGGVAQRWVWLGVVVLVLLVGDQDVGVGQGVEVVDVQALVVEVAVERFEVPVVPG